MRTIDADAHVIETTATWQYMVDGERKYKPIPVSAEAGDRIRGTNRDSTEFWAVDGILRPREQNIGTDVSRESREMSDIAGRIAHMDELSIDVQVLYPSLFLRPLTRKPEVELALIRSYNRWLTDIWKRGKGRLRWVALPPVKSLADPGLARDELAIAKANGACGIFLCGFSCDRMLPDPYFFPLYEIAQDLDMPICIHVGMDAMDIFEFFDKSYSDGLARFKFPVISAFHSLMQQEIPLRFPKVRWAFVEAASGWIPYVLKQMEYRFTKRYGKPFPTAPLADNNMFVTCQANEDLSYIIDVAGEDNLMVGTDYGHNDNSTQIEAIRSLKDGVALSGAVANKILGANAARLYGI